VNVPADVISGKGRPAITECIRHPDIEADEAGRRKLIGYHRRPLDLIVFLDVRRIGIIAGSGIFRVGQSRNAGKAETVIKIIEPLQGFLPGQGQ